MQQFEADSSYGFDFVKVAIGRKFPNYYTWTIVIAANSISSKTGKNLYSIS